MITEHQRRTDRVNIKMPVRVSAVDATGQKLSEQGHTLTISRYGATIVLNRQLVPGLHLTIRTSNGESSAVLLGQIGGQSGVHVYGIAFLEQSVNLWAIRFPPLAESESGLVRLLLACSVCKASEVVHLNELETDVFEGSQNLPRSCSQCNTWTIWVQIPSELPAELSGAQPKILPESSVALVNEASKKRKHVRVKVDMNAYIRHAGFEDEIVKVNDVSRGGFSFVSSKEYIEGSRIEVSVPYSGGKANIFVAARIIRVQGLAGKEQTRYGARYIQAG